MKNFSVLVISLLLVFIIFGCGEDKVFNNDNNNPTENPPNYVDGLNLMGFANNRLFSYLKTDTIVSLDSTYDVRIETSQIEINITGNTDNWIIYNNGKPVSNIKVSNYSILQNGYWKSVNEQNQISYFSVPPTIMPRTLKTDITWSGSFPPYNDNVKLFLNSYFGFYFEKKFIGIQRIKVPAGEFDVYRFDVNLFENEHAASPAVYIQEYYAPNLGLVKHYMSGGPLKQTLSLIDTTTQTF